MDPLVLARPVEPATALRPGVIEVLDRNGQVAQRLRLDAHAPLCVGRAYDNDLILDDPYVSPHHLRIEAGPDGISAVDLDSDNGLYLDDDEQRHTRLVLAADTVIRLGETRLRYRPSDYSVPPTLAAVSQPQRWLERPWLPLLLVPATAGFTALTHLLESVERLRPAKLLLATAAPLLLIALWAGLWALASRLFGHRFRYGVHVTIASIALLGAGLLELLLDYLGFALDLDGLELPLQALGGTLIGAALLYGHLCYCSQVSRRRLALSAGLLASGVLALVSLQQLARDPFSAAPRYHITLKPPAFQLHQGEPSAEFFQRLPQLQQRLQQALAESAE
ncbi:MAG TPA: FHA domain-containing protein [Candidatus Competibacteraceae bacterium]|nr:FHA domain-containing protein [Candidatus Competibacteraceae bacterium]